MSCYSHLSATRGSPGPTEILFKALWATASSQTAHQSAVNAPVQGQMEQTNSALPLRIQITPLDSIGSQASWKL